MDFFLEDNRKNSLLNEIGKEVLNNTIYYIDTNYHEIAKRNGLQEDTKKVNEKKQELENIQRELETIEESICSMQLEVENLRKLTHVEKIEGTVDLKVLLEKVSERRNELCPQSSLSLPLSDASSTVYSVDFVNTRMLHISEDKIHVLDRIKNCLSKSADSNESLRYLSGQHH